MVIQMTNEEAIEVLKDMKGVFDTRSHNQYSLPALDLAIKTLKKQVPVKPKYLRWCNFGCPECEKELPTGSQLKRYPHCPNCGQAL